MVRNSNLIKKLHGKEQVVVKKKESLPLSFMRLLGLRKDTAGSFFSFFLSVLSLASAHYFGFMAQVPFEMVSIVAVDFLPEFIAVFVFYFTMSYTVAKIFAFPAAQFVFMYLRSLSGFAFVLKRIWPRGVRKSGSKLYKDTVRLEGVIYWGLLAFGVYVLFDFCYLRLDFSKVGAGVWIFAISTLVAFLVKAGFAVRNPVRVLSRLRDKNRIAYKRSLIKGSTAFLGSVLLGFSCYFGYLRFDKVADEDSVYIESERFSGVATILMKSGESFLLLDKGADVETFYYINDKFSVKLEDSKSKKSEPVESVSLQW